MRTSLVCCVVFLVVLSCFPENIDAWGRYRRWRWQPYPHYRRPWVKRSLSDMVAPPMPCSFNFFDESKDGRISSSEFGAKTRFVDFNQVKKVFLMMDKDGNNEITREEFDGKPAFLENHHIFEKCKGN